VCLHEVGQPVQQLLTAAIAHPGPGTFVEGQARGGDGEVIQLAAERDLCPGLAGPRVDRRETCAVGLLDFLAADDVATPMAGLPS